MEFQTFNKILDKIKNDLKVSIFEDRRTDKERTENGQYAVFKLGEVLVSNKFNQNQQIILTVFTLSIQDAENIHRNLVYDIKNLLRFNDVIPTISEKKITNDGKYQTNISFYLPLVC